MICVLISRIGTLRNGVTSITMDLRAVCGISMAGMKSGASGNTIGAGNTTALFN